MTPGPWNLEEQAPELEHDGFGSYILRCGPDIIGAITAKPSDARAMASAPALVDALRLVLSAAGTTPWVRSLARTALNSATGQEALV